MRSTFTLLALIFSAALPLAAAAPTIKAERSADKIVVSAQASPGSSVILATHNLIPGSLPFLHPFLDSSGRQVLTQERPADHPWQHGIITGFQRVNGFNYWKEDEGRQRLDRV